MDNSQESETFACTECTRRFKTTEKLREHAVHEHLCKVLKDDNVIINSHEELEKWKFQKLKSIYANSRNDDINKSATSNECMICGQIFATDKNRRRHVIRVHKINLNFESKLSFLKCSECKLIYNSASEFKEHISIKHPYIVLKEQQLTFRSEKEFNKFKDEFSKLTVTRYIKIVKYTNSFGEVQYYRCHRSGTYKTKGNGQRHMKFSGSNKTGYYCPATIRVQYSNTEETVNVRLQTTHMGHSFEVGRLSLTQQEKEQLVDNLKSGVPVKRLLQDISKTADPHTRLASTNLQDLRNISISYGIDLGIVSLKNDVLSVDSWVEQLRTSEDNPILIYKPVGATLEHSDIKDDDFVLGFMNDAQEYIFRTYGNDIVSIDSTVGTNKYGIQLTSIIVKDDNHECFPVAFLWSNQQTEEVFKLFFTSVYKRINQIKNKAFISDDNPAYYNAWKSVFGESKFNLLCSWHLKKVWAKNASSGSTRIQNSKKRRNVLDFLHFLLSEVNELDFQHLADSHIPLLLEDEETHKFGKYFVQNFYNRKQQWAACFRVGTNININIAIEKWHMDLKHSSDLQENCDGCLEKMVNSLVESLQTKLMNRLVSFDREILFKKKMLMRKNHLLAVVKLNDVTLVLEDENVWTIESFTEKDKVYKIRSLQIGEMHKCNLKCEVCNVCLHQYCCNCLESAIKYNFCKHIHLLCLKRNGLTDSCESSFHDEGNSLDNSISIVKENIIGKELYLTDSCESSFDEEGISDENSTSGVGKNFMSKESCLKTKSLAHSCEILLDEEDNLVGNSTSAVVENVFGQELSLTDSSENLFNEEDISVDNSISTVEKSVLCKESCEIKIKEDAKAAVLSCIPIVESCTSSKQFELIIQTMNRLKRKCKEIAETEEQFSMIEDNLLPNKNIKKQKLKM